MMSQEERALAAAMEERISSDPWAALLFTGTMPGEERAPLESGIFEIPVLTEAERIRAA